MTVVGGSGSCGCICVLGGNIGRSSVAVSGVRSGYCFVNSRTGAGGFVARFSFEFNPCFIPGGVKAGGGTSCG